LKGGQTSHSAFKIPIDVGKEAECGVDNDSLLASILAAAELIIWDEVVTIPMNCINAVDRTLRRVAQCNKPFGGKVVIFSGDFRQTLPVVKYNKFPPLYLATLRSSKFWKCVEEFQLTENMRLAEALNGPSNHENEAFAKTLLQLGKGRRQRNDFAVIKPKGINVILCGTTREMNGRLLDFVYGGLQGVNMNDNKELIDYLIARCILAPLNCHVKELNDTIMAQLTGEAMEMISIDTPDPDGFDSLPEECLNVISVSGLPEHCLLLKVGMPIVVTRNLNIAGGICNGTRVLIKDLSRSYIKGLLMTGPLKGRQVMIP
jgi:hypothetical protein